MKLATVGAAFSLLFMSATALAQTPPASPPPAEPETLTTGASTGGTKLSGWFLAPTFGTTGFDGRLSYTPGLRGGIYLNKRFAVGLTAQGLASSDTTLKENQVRNLGSYGGLLLQYIWHSDQLIHATLESTIGNGRWCASGTTDGCATKEFLVFEPAANLELNIAKHVRFASGVGYRFAVAGSGEGPSSRDMSSLVVRSSLIFGSF
ncbi:MAG: hypothetical protein JWM82_3563 [Myxococcales bacterium]|nr:hypothetical protein [Myxococcales bacterium]